MKAGQKIRLRVLGLSRHGDGLGEHAGTEVHVPGLFPGEQGIVVVEHVSRQRPRAHGRVLERAVDHPGRRPSPCRHHGTCSGCSLMELDVRSQRELKRGLLREQYGLEIDRFVGTDDEGLYYRWSSKRIVGGRVGDVQLGSFVRGTHDVAAMNGCLVDHPDIVAVADEVRLQANALGIEPYEETNGTGDLRYVWLKTNGRGEVLLTLVTAEPLSRAARELPSVLERPLGVAWAVQSSIGNALRGVTVRPLRGPQSLAVDLAGVTVYVGPLGFLQPNPRVAALAYQDLVRVPAGGAVRGRLAFDLYAGTGITTSLLKSRFDRVVACESFPESARALGVEPELAERFLSQVLDEARHPYREVDLVIANPPRGGLGSAVCDGLNRLRSARLHIMSCSPQSLVEDLSRLTGEDGAYRLLAVRAFDTLPQTPHVELVAWLVSKGGS